METQVGSRVTEAQATAWMSSLKHRMYQGEQVAALSKTKLIRPMADAMTVTSARVMAFLTKDISGGKIAVEVFADDIALVDVKKRLTGSNTLIVRNRSGMDVSFGDIPTEDAGMIVAKVQQLKAGDEDSPWRAAR